MNVREDMKLMSIQEVANTGLIPEYRLRQLVKEGTIPFAPFGNKKVVNYFTVEQYLFQQTAIA